MATLAAPVASSERPPDLFAGTPRTHAIDRWIFVGMAAWFIVIVLTGFIPDSLMKVGMVRAGLRPPFPFILHVHAALMGTFLLLLLVQTWLMANGKGAHHRQLGVLAAGVAVALVVVGFMVAQTMYLQLWNGMRAAQGPLAEKLRETVGHAENIRLIQIRIGILFSIFVAIAIRARRTDPGLHKRMMILATAVALPAGFDRISWLPTTLPASPTSADLYVLAAIAPMFAWDVLRNRRVHRAYGIWLAVCLSVSIPVHALWDTPGWHSDVQGMSGVR